MIQSFGITGKHKQVNATVVSNFIFMLLLGHMIFWLALFAWSDVHWILAEIGSWILPTLFFLRRKERAVYQITFDDDTRICTVYYYLLLFVKSSRKLTYEESIFRYVPTMYGRFIFINTFQVLKKKRVLFEVRQQYNAGWEKKEIRRLYEYTRSNSLLHYDNEALKRMRSVLLPE